MSDLAKAGLNTVVGLADHTTEAASIAIRETAGAVTGTASTVVDLGGETLEQALNAAEALRQDYVSRIRRIAEAVANIV